MDNIENLVGALQRYGLDGELKKAQYYKFISELLHHIHSQIPHENYNKNKVAAPINIREEIFQGINYKRAVMFLLTNGCEWALRNGNGCTMCGHLAKQLRSHEIIPDDDYLNQFDEQFRKIDFKTCPLLNLYNNGSFFNDNEISPGARRAMLKKIGQEKHIKMLVLETRPEFATEKKMKEVKMLVPGKHIEIAIGLEIKNDLYRTVCINKGFKLRQFEDASRIIRKYHNLRTYVLLKPPFLTERESIENAVETIEHAFDSGASTVSLEGCTVQDYTLVNYFYEKGSYTPPWLWSIIEVIKRVKTPGKLIIGLFQFYPSPSKTPFNCEKCSHRIFNAICNYNRTLDKRIFEGLTCQCKIKWEETLEEEFPSFKKRIEIALNGLKE
ncbi:MAG: archaeosine biosynthesis radical SAM protein RaSEA [Candidatus Aminicenantes bacterium]|jgi:radical SAM enzyme (TIGR01210 family)